MFEYNYQDLKCWRHLIKFQDINECKKVPSSNFNSGGGCYFQNIKFIFDSAENYLKNFHIYYLFSVILSTQKLLGRFTVKIKKLVRFTKCLQRIHAILIVTVRAQRSSPDYYQSVIIPVMTQWITSLWVKYWIIPFHKSAAIWLSPPTCFSKIRKAEKIYVFVQICKLPVSVHFRVEGSKSTPRLPCSDSNHQVQKYHRCGRRSFPLEILDFVKKYLSSTDLIFVPGLASEKHHQVPLKSPGLAKNTGW